LIQEKKAEICLLEAKVDLAQLEVLQDAKCGSPAKIGLSDCNGLNFTCSSISSATISSWSDVCSIPFDLDSLGIDSSSIDSNLVVDLTDFDLSQCIADMDGIVKDEFVDSEFLMES